MAWYMRGGSSYQDVLNMSSKERQILNEPYIDFIFRNNFSSCCTCSLHDNYRRLLQNTNLMSNVRVHQSSYSTVILSLRDHLNVTQNISHRIKWWFLDYVIWTLFSLLLTTLLNITLTINYHCNSLCLSGVFEYLKYIIGLARQRLSLHRVMYHILHPRHSFVKNRFCCSSMITTPTFQNRGSG